MGGVNLQRKEWVCICGNSTIRSKTQVLRFMYISGDVLSFILRVSHFAANSKLIRRKKGKNTNCSD